MIIHEAQPYKNKKGKQETPAQYYFFMEYWKLPRLARTIPNLIRILKHKEEQGTLEHPLVSETTFYRYKKENQWEERIHHHLNHDDIITQRIDDDIQEYNEAQAIVKDMLRQLKGMRQHTNWKDIDFKDSDAVDKLNKNQETFNNTILALFDANVGLTEMITSAEVLRDLNRKDEDILPTDDLLTDDIDDEDL